MDLALAIQDPSPMGVVQSWSCGSAKAAGTSNVAHWCDPEFDQLVSTAVLKGDPAAWRSAFARMSADHPAVFLAAPVNLVAVHTRFDNVDGAPRPTLALALAMARATRRGAGPRPLR